MPDQLFKAAVTYVLDTNVDLQALANGYDIGYATLETGDSILLIGQTDASENGAYDVGAQGPARTADLDEQSDWTQSFYIEVTFLGRQYFWAYVSGFTLETSDADFVQVTPGTVSNARSMTSTPPGSVSHARSLTSTPPGSVSHARSLTSTPPTEVV